MGVRPPQNDTSPPDTIEFGIAALDARLEETSIVENNPWLRLFLG